MRPSAARQAIEIADQCGVEVVGIQLRDDRFEKRARPRDRRDTRGEAPHCSRTNFVPPPLGLEALLAPGGFSMRRSTIALRLSRIPGPPRMRHARVQSRVAQWRRAWPSAGYG